MNHQDGATPDDGHAQFLTFRVGSEEFGLDILAVQEIRGWTGATPLPHTPAYMLGVINLRGSVVSVIDLRRRFAAREAEFGPTTVVIVVRVVTGSGSKIVGFVVDAVCEVYDVKPEYRKPVPDGIVAGRDFIQGLATVEDKMIILLDVERLYAAADVNAHLDSAA